MDLFRSAAVAEQRRGLHGEVIVSEPRFFRVLTAVFVAFSLVVGVIACTANFDKRESVAGWIVPEFGMADAFGAPGAVVRTVEVRVGQKVIKGQTLASFSTETYDARGAVSAQEQKQVTEQLRQVGTQIASLQGRNLIDTQRAERQRFSLKKSVNWLRERIRFQEAQLAIAKRQVAESDPVAKRGFISRSEQDRKVSAVLELEQAGVELESQINTQQSQLDLVDSDLRTAREQRAMDVSQLKMSQAGLVNSALGTSTRSGATLRAPVSGSIVAVNARPGETIKQGLPLVSIAPPGRTEVELILSTKSAGLIRLGEVVALQVDAFPFQHYGQLKGIVEEVSHTAVLPGQYDAPIKIVAPSYRIRVAVGSTRSTNGEVLSLQPGMTLNGIITTERRTVLQWIFDPVLAAKRSLQSD